MLGQSFKSPQIFKRKTVLGSIGFLIGALAVAFFLYRLPDTLPLSTLVIGAFAATVFEALPLPWDDNFSVPIMSGFVMSFF